MLKKPPCYVVYIHDCKEERTFTRAISPCKAHTQHLKFVSQPATRYVLPRTHTSVRSIQWDKQTQSIGVLLSLLSIERSSHRLTALIEIYVNGVPPLRDRTNLRSLQYFFGSTEGECSTREPFCRGRSIGNLFLY